MASSTQRRPGRAFGTRMDSRVSLRNPPSNVPPTPASLEAEKDLRLSGTAALGALAADDPRLQALRRACSLLAHLEAERRKLDDRLISANRKDPMKVVTGRTSLDEAVDSTRDLIRQLDDMLCEAAETARRTP